MSQKVNDSELLIFLKSCMYNIPDSNMWSFKGWKLANAETIDECLEKSLKESNDDKRKN